MPRSGPTHRLGPYRDPNVDANVLRTTRELLVERGYRGTTIDAIAEAAGVSRPTIYRRWPSKAHVVYDAVFPEDAPTVHAEADFLTVLTEVTKGITAFMSDPTAREALPGLMADMRAETSLQPTLLARHNEGVTAGLAELVDRNPGQARPGLDPQVLVDVIAGAALHAMCIRNVSDVDSFVAALSDLLLHGVLDPESSPG